MPGARAHEESQSDPIPKPVTCPFALSRKRSGSWTVAPQYRIVPCPPLDLSASVNGEATSQKGGSMEDKEQEKEQNSGEGPVGGFSEDLLHNE